jgi:serine/threonine-protein kinase
MANSPARSAIDVGSVIAGTYTIEALIGRGGMGSVFLASHNRLPGKKVAIKLLHAEIADDDVLARFKREADIASQLDHPNIVKVDDYNVLPDGTPYILLEYLHGESLAQRLTQGPLELDQVMSIVRQVGSALAAAHRAGIVHRDLKPQNIFLVPTEVDGRVVEIAKVLDFGISKIRGSQTVKTQESSLLGTPQYMSPEQATGRHDSVDERTDVFAFGAIVYEMLAGHPAFSGASIPEVVFKVVYEQPAPIASEVPTLAPGIVAAIEQAMAKDSNNRFANVGGFVEAVTGKPLITVRPGSLPPPELGFAAGSRVRSASKSEAKDAFAQTMGSGDHAEAIAHTASPPVFVRASSPTVDSQHRASSQPVDSTSPATTVPPAPQKRTGLVIGAVIGGATLAAIAMYFVMRGGSDPVAAREPVAPKVATTAAADASVRPPDPPHVASVTPPGTATTPDAKKLAAPEVKDVKKDGPKPDAKKASSAASGAAPPPPPPVETDDGDATAKQKLQDAEAALRGGDLARAEQLANSVINGETSGPNQKQHAHAIRGSVMCLLHNDEDGARTDLRRMGNAPRLRKRVITACHNAGLMNAE